MGTQGAPCSDMSESDSEGRETRESVLMMDAQECAEPVEPEHALTEEERANLDRMLTDRYGIPWILSVRELDITCMTENDQEVANEPEQICSLTMTNNVYPLPKVAEMRLCHVNLEFVGVGVTGILDTGAQRSLLSASSYERVHTRLPPLMQPSVGAKRMVGASGELRRCPVLLNGYEYHVNLVVADLGTVDTILGMDILTAYGVTINLKNDTESATSSLRARCVSLKRR